MSLKKFSLAWFLIIAFCIICDIYFITSGKFKLNSDILNLLPIEKEDYIKQEVLNKMFKSSEQQILILIASADWNEAKLAANFYENKILNNKLVKKVVNHTSNIDSISLFTKYKNQLLTYKSIKDLEQNSVEHWLELSLAKVYGFSSNGFIPWQQDPFNVFNDWIQSRLLETPIREKEGNLFINYENNNYIIIPLEILSSAFSNDTQKAILPILNNLKQEVKEKFKVQVLSTGMIFYADKVATQAKKEISVIGTGSLLGICLLIWLSFKTLKPILLVASSIISGICIAILISFLIYKEIHIISLIFGASIIGLAQDYGIYYLCNRTHTPNHINSWELVKALIPTIGLSLITTIIAYIALSFTPFLGLQQMAIFAITGLISAWLTVIFLFPLVKINHYLGLNKYQELIHYYPKLKKPVIFIIITILLSLVLTIKYLTVNDDIRVLQNQDKELIAEQEQISKIIQLPSVAQFYLIQAQNNELLLQKEEKLSQKLNELQNKHIIQGFNAISSWIPSQQRQEKNKQLIFEKLYQDAIFKKLEELTGIQNDFNSELHFLTIDEVMQNKNTKFLKSLYLGKSDNQVASIITIKGVNKHNLQILKKLGNLDKNIVFIDKVSDISHVLGKYRTYISIFLFITYLLIFFLLHKKYKIQALRIIISPMLASLITLSLLAILGKSLNLFNILAFLLILGVGVDSGIFFMEQAKNNLKAVWLETGLSCSSTMLSFGLLSLSKTPALHSFGITMLIGICLVWLIVPLLRYNDEKLFKN